MTFKCERPNHLLKASSHSKLCFSLINLLLSFRSQNTKKKCLRFGIFNSSEKLQNIFEIGLKKCGVITQKSLSEKTSFPGSSLFLPRERTLVAAGHVTAHDKLLPSQGTLALLFYLQEPNRDFQAGAI